MGLERIGSILNIEYQKENINSQYSILNIRSKRNKAKYSEKAAQQKALYLVDKFKNPSGLKFYLKCAWNLTDEYLDWLTEYSQKKKSPAHYFISVANQRMTENK